MAFKIIHSSDWHLGKRLYKSERLDEQRLFLDWMVELIQKEKTDLLLIAGDIFDTPFPPTEALRLYFYFLKRISDETNCQVVLIAGNHDSGRFLEAPLPFLKERRIHIVGNIPSNPADLLLRLKNDEGEELELFALPFFRNHELQDLAEELKIEFNNENCSQFFEKFFEKYLPQKTGTRFFMGHHQFGSTESEGSELALSISGLGGVPLEPFKTHFDYLALGHIHRPCSLCKEPYAIYSGSPIPWRFSEGGKKFIYSINADQSKLVVDKITIPVFRQLLRFTIEQETWKEELDEQLKALCNAKLSPFAEVHIKLQAPSHEIAEKIRKIFKEKDIDLLAYHCELPETIRQSEIKSSWRELSLEGLLAGHFKEKFGQDELPVELQESFRVLLQMAAQGGK